MNSIFVIIIIIIIVVIIIPFSLTLKDAFLDSCNCWSITVWHPGRMIYLLFIPTTYCDDHSTFPVERKNTKIAYFYWTCESTGGGWVEMGLVKPADQ